MINDSYNSDPSYQYKKELFRLNCVEISSETINPKFEEHPILLVDNVIKDKELNDYEQYVLTGRSGMPSWKDYYAIKNLVETLKEIDSLDNDQAVTLLSKVEETFIQKLFDKIKVSKKKLTSPLKNLLFSILQKLEFFYPNDDRLLQLILYLDQGGTITTNQLEAAKSQYDTIFADDHYFLNDEKIIIELTIAYFASDDLKKFNKKIKAVKKDRIKERLPNLLSKIQVE